MPRPAAFLAIVLVVGRLMAPRRIHLRPSSPNPKRRPRPRRDRRNGALGRASVLLAGLAVAGLSVLPTAPAGAVDQEQELVGPELSSDDQFGASVAIDGDYAVVGARFVDLGDEVDAGAAFVFRRESAEWLFDTMLTAPEPGAGDRFGDSVAIHGDTIVVGACCYQADLSDAGAAYVFTLDTLDPELGWTFDQQLAATEPSEFPDHFGWSVGIDDDVIVVGAPDRPEGGAAYVFRFRGGVEGWSQEAELTPLAPDPGARFGVSVAISGPRIIVGASLYDLGPEVIEAGQAFTFRHEGEWSQDSAVTAPDPQPGAEFGRSVDISDGFAVVGAPFEDIGEETDAGAAYLLADVAGFEATDRLTSEDIAAADNFGFSVAIADGVVLVGEPGDDDPDATDAGAALAFTPEVVDDETTIWNGEAFGPSVPTSNAQFGSAVALDRLFDTAVVGAPAGEPSALTGTAFTFTGLGRPAEPEPSSPPPPTVSRDVFLDEWASTDVDESDQTLVMSAGEGESDVIVELHDTNATVACDGGGPATGTGIGTYDGGVTVTVALTIVCLEEDTSSPTDPISFTYQPSDDTLIDSFETVWHRAASMTVELTADIDAEAAGVEAGAASVDIADIPLDSIPLASGTVEFAPLRSIPLRSIPLRSIPLRSIPLRSIDLAGDPLTSILLSSIPLTSDGGWEAVLVGTDFEGVPLHTVTLHDVVQLDPPNLASVTLSDVDLSASPLRSIGLASVVLGATPLRSIPLPGGQGWCAFLLTLDFACGDFGVTDDSTLLALDIAGVPLRSIPLRSIPLRSIDLAESPLRSIKLAELSIGVSPLRSIPLDVIAVADSPLRTIPLRSIPLRSIDPGDPDSDLEASPLRSIPLRSIDLCESIVDELVVDETAYCSATGTLTLGDAADAGAIADSATLGDIAETLGDIADLFGDFILGDLLFYGDVTIGDIYEEFPDDITLAAVLIALLDALDYPWEELPLEEMGIQDFASGGQFQYLLTFDVTGTESADVEVSLRLPAGFRHVPQENWQVTSAAGELSFARRVDAPTEDDGEVTFTLADMPVDTPLTLAVPVRPGLRLGSFTATATVRTIGGVASASDEAAVTVIETFEPNDDPATAPTLDGGTLYLSYITSGDDLDFFRIPAPAPGSRISIHLSHLSDDNDLVVYSPEGSDLLAGSPRTIGLQGDPVEDDGVDLNPSDDSLAPETLQDVPLVLDHVASVSAARETQDERVEAVSRGGDESDFYTIQVSGYNGATSDQPYVLRVEVDQPVQLPTCDPRTFDFAGEGTAGSSPASLPGGLNTVFIVNQQRLGDTFGADGQAAIMAALDELAGRGDLGVTGLVVPLEGDPTVAGAYADWDDNPCDPAAANAVVAAIGGVIDDIRTQRPTLEHVVLVGGDDLIPMARVPDHTTLANERDYAATFGDTNNAYLGAFATEHILSDDPYVDFDPIPFLDRHLYVPDMAIGRLVETPDQIAGAIENFMDPTVEGRLDPQTALVTGYDFLTDGAGSVADALAATGVAVDQLVDETWDSAELLEHFLPLGGEAPDIASINAHYDHNRSLPALGNLTGDETNLFSTQDVEASQTSLLGRILFTMGCHAGLSVSDVIVGGTDPLGADWAQTYAASGAAAYAANTGFGYGDTAAVAYSERLMELLAARLDGTMSIGQALTFAKQEYFGRLGVVSVYDEKAMTEAVFYGLPMYRLGDGATPPPPPAPPETFTDPVTGLEAASIDLAPGFNQVSTPIGEYYEANLPGTSADVQVTHYRPIQPRVEVDVTQPDAIAHDALITHLAQAQDETLDGAFSRPIIDLAAHEPETSFGDAIFPSRLQSVTTFNAPDGQRQRLVVIPGQFFTDPDPTLDGAGIQRLFTEVEALVMYGDADGADFTRPTIRSASATEIGSTVTFEVEAEDVDAAAAGTATAAGVLRVLVLFHDAANPLVWTPVELVQAAGTTRWTGGAAVVDGSGNPVTDPNIEYFVQAVDASGNVGVSSNKGRYFAAVALPPVPADVAVAPDVPPSGWFTDDVTVTVAGEDLSRSVDGGAAEPFTEFFTVSGDGVHSVDVLRGTEVIASLVIPIDTTAPLVVIDSPPDGAVYAQDESVTAAFRCVDALSGVASCTGSVADGSTIDTAAVGAGSVKASATDAAGNTRDATRQYEVHYRFDGFFAPVNKPLTVNEVRAGRGVPVKFSLDGDQGLEILASPPTSQEVICISALPSSTVDETVTAGSSDLKYDAASDQYIYVWKTSREWEGQCRVFTLVLVDGTTHWAIFSFD